MSHRKTLYTKIGRKTSKDIIMRVRDLISKLYKRETIKKTSEIDHLQI